VRIGGVDHDTSALTLDELGDIEVAADRGWYFINPTQRTRDARALLAFYLIRDGAADEEVRARIGKLTARSLGRVFTLVDSDESLPDEFADGLPKAEAAPGTSGCAGEPSASGGPQT
jgi:hypothetical protein